MSTVRAISTFWLIAVLLAAGCKSGDGEGGKDTGGTAADTVGGDAVLDGQGDPNVTVIGPEGGTVTSACGAVLEIPPGALEYDTPIRVTEGEPLFMDSSYVPSGPFCHFEPDGLGFLQPVIATFPFDPGEGAAKPALFLYWESTKGLMTTSTLVPALIDWDGKKLTAPVETFSIGGPVTLPDSTRICCVKPDEGLFTVEYVAASDCTSQGGEVQDLGLCYEVCCSLELNGSQEIFITAGAACIKAGGAFLPYTQCAAVCCVTGEGGAQAMLASDCGAATGEATGDLADCDPVCCSISADYYSEIARVECVELGGAQMEAGECEEVCCQVGDAGFVTTERGACVDAGGFIQDDATLCESICCGISGTGIVAAREMTRGQCEQEGFEAPVESCQEVCCTMGGQDGVVSQLLPQWVCEQSAGGSAPAEDCQEVCCVVSAFGLTAAFVTSKAQCDLGGTVGEAALCEEICCVFADSEQEVQAKTAPRMACESIGGFVGDPGDCTEVCCGGDAGNGGLAVRCTQARCNLSGLSVVDSAECEHVCCQIADDFRMLSKPECQKLGGTALADQSKCEKVCCGVSGLGGSGAVLTSASVCELAGTELDPAMCELVCCAASAGKGAVSVETERYSCQEAGGTVVESDWCDEVCCQLSAFGMSGCVNSSLHECDQAGIVVSGDLCEDACCIVTSAKGMETGMVPKWACQKAGGTLGTDEDCDEVCCAVEFMGFKGAISVARAVCEKAGYPAEETACEEVCCITGADTAKLDAKVMPRWACDQFGDVEAEADDCEKVCCAFSEFGFSGAVKVARAICDLGGYPAKDDYCNNICCVWNGNATVMNKLSCESFGGKPQSVPDLCNQVCCKKPYKTQRTTEYKCRKSGGKVTPVSECWYIGTECTKDWQCKTENQCEKGICRDGYCKFVALYGKSCADGDLCTQPDTCDVDGTCKGPSIRSCEGKQCGDDGCGGSCGVCAGGQSCVAGKCEGGSSGGATCRCGDSGVVLTPSPCAWNDAAACSGLASVFCSMKCGGGGGNIDCWTACEENFANDELLDGGRKYCAGDCCITVSCP